MWGLRRNYLYFDYFLISLTTSMPLIRLCITRNAKAIKVRSICHLNRQILESLKYTIPLTFI